MTMWERTTQHPAPGGAMKAQRPATVDGAIRRLIEDHKRLCNMGCYGGEACRLHDEAAEELAYLTLAQLVSDYRRPAP